MVKHAIGSTPTDVTMESDREWWVNSTVILERVEILDTLARALYLVR